MFRNTRKAFAKMTGKHHYFDPLQNTIDKSAEPLNDLVPSILERQRSYDSDNKSEEHGVSYLDNLINQNQEFTQYFQNMPASQIQAIKDYQGNYYGAMNKSASTGIPSIRTLALDAAFNSAPPVNRVIITYRCYKKDMPLEKLIQNSGKPLNWYTSVSLSKNLVERWCSIPGYTNLQVSIIIPPYSRNTIPIFYKHF